MYIIRRERAFDYEQQALAGKREHVYGYIVIYVSA